MKFSDIITDNEGDLDIISIIALVTCIVACSLTIYIVIVQGKDFNIQDFGIAIAAIIGSAGGGYYAKSNQYSKYRPRNIDSED